MMLGRKPLFTLKAPCVACPFTCNFLRLHKHMARCHVKDFACWQRPPYAAVMQYTHEDAPCIPPHKCSVLLAEGSRLDTLITPAYQLYQHRQAEHVSILFTSTPLFA